MAYNLHVLKYLALFYLLFEFHYAADPVHHQLFFFLDSLSMISQVELPYLFSLLPVFFDHENLLLLY